jgi:EAL domain-containing protein (putative c-di-GMP-specific phosphodiesterase class I)/GGDEF domain-containing protein
MRAMRWDGVGAWLRERLGRGDHDPSGASGYDTIATALAEHDIQSGLLNREGVRALLQQWLGDHPDDCRVAVAYFEVDGITYLTRMHGPDTVDHVVTAVSSRLGALSSENTQIARMGTGEFVVVRRYEGVDDGPHDTEALDVLESEIQSGLRGAWMPSIPRQRSAQRQSGGIPRVSMGMASGNLATLKEPWSLLQLAQSLAREARRRGGNSTLREGHGLGARLHRRDDIAMAMHSAVANRELRVVFHPIVELATGRAVCAEALLRWNSTPLGSIMPDEFIPLMEGHRSMRMVDNWVLNQALETLLDYDSPAVAVSVNASPLSLEDEDYAGTLLGKLDRLGLARSQIWIEVTETALAMQPQRVLETLARLRAADVRVLLDDFGSGYSSLNTFAELPIDWVKLDGRLVSGARESPRQREVVRFATRLAVSLGHEVVAEHIETPADQRIAIDAGCAYGQGYLYSEPTSDFAAAVSLHTP